MYNIFMFTSSSLIKRAIEFNIPVRKRNFKKKISVFGRKKYRFYYGDRESYRNDYLKSEHWFGLKKEKLILNSVCEKCGSNKNLDVHHLNYKNLYDVTTSDLMTLCRSCHIDIHSKKRQTKRCHNKIKNIFSRKSYLINKVAKIADIDVSTVEFHYNKLVHNNK